jgi:hypothetical protein
LNRVGGDAEHVNCFSTFLKRGDDAKAIVLLTIEGSNAGGLEYDGDRYANGWSSPLASIDPNSVSVTHYYGISEVRYTGIWDLAWGLGFRLPYAHIQVVRAWGAIAQKLFNRRSFVTCDRLELLRSVVQAYTSGQDPVSATDLLSTIYGDRWAGHPRWRAHHDQVQKMLEMLASSGELVEVGGDFRPTGLALRAIEESEEEDRKHVANWRIQILLAVVAVIGLVMAAAQAGLFKLPLLVDVAAWLK